MFIFHLNSFALIRLNYQHNLPKSASLESENHNATVAKGRIPNSRNFHPFISFFSFTIKTICSGCRENEKQNERKSKNYVFTFSHFHFPSFTLRVYAAFSSCYFFLFVKFSFTSTDTIFRTIRNHWMRKIYRKIRTKNE